MEQDQSFFVSFSYFLHFCVDLLHSMLCIKIYWHMLHAVQLILTIEIIREFVMSLQVIIYAKQNGAQMATFAATSTRADIDDLRRKTMAALGTRLGRLGQRNSISSILKGVASKKFSGGKPRPLICSPSLATYPLLKAGTWLHHYLRGT